MQNLKLYQENLKKIVLKLIVHAATLLFSKTKNI